MQNQSRHFLTQQKHENFMRVFSRSINGFDFAWLSLSVGVFCDFCPEFGIEWNWTADRWYFGLTKSVLLRQLPGAVSTSGFSSENSRIFNFWFFFRNAYATASARSTNDSLERSLKRLDNDVRRVGRISRRDIEDVLEEIKSNRSATSSQSLLVIRCCGNLVPEELPEVRTALVQEIWKTLNNLNIPMDISHYNALLRVYLENEHSFSPSEFLADLESKGIEPNR